MNQSYISLRFTRIERRFKEIDTLVDLSTKYISNLEVYQSLCRSAHILLVSHFEGIYKDICKDIIDDINANTRFYQVKKDIALTHCDFFLQNKDESKLYKSYRDKLLDAFKEFPSNIKSEQFLYVDNKNPTPDIIETILKRFGIQNFFWSLVDSDLDIVFQNTKKGSARLRDRLIRYIRKNTATYPYTTDVSIYNPSDKSNQKKVKTLWHDFINSFLKQRHDIIHGDMIDSPTDHSNILEAKLKIEVLVYVYIINLCSVSNPLIFLPASSPLPISYVASE